MFALEALDRYIQQHEVTLQSISKQKLTRKPVPVHNEPTFLSNASQFDISMGSGCRPSIATELQNMIMRLQHLQQSRLSQLQQANALFLHEMNIEDQFNMEVKTEQEHNNELAADEFEAFLLGEQTNNEVQLETLAPTEEVKHSTLFTRTKRSKPSDQNTKPEFKNENISNQQNLSTEGKVEQEELSMSFTDDVIMKLQRSRQERTQQLRNIATALQCTSVQSKSYPLSTFKTDVLDLGNLSSAPVVGDHLQFNAAKAAQETMNLSNNHSEQVLFNTIQEAPITLQSILDDEQFAVTSSGTTEQEAFVSVPPVLPIPPVPEALQGACEFTTGNSNTYLVNNQSRKAIELQLVERSKQNLNLANHGVTGKADKHSHKNIREAPIPPRSPRATAVNPSHGHSDQENLHGIGYGSRYEHTIYGNSKVDRWDESSVGSADGSVRSLDQNYITSTYHNTGHNNNNRSNIFDYADALESPQRKYHSSRTTTNSTTTAAAGNTKHVVFADTSDTPILQRAVEVESRVSRYYKQRMHRLELGGDFSDSETVVNISTSRNTIYVDNIQANMLSPERPSKSDHNFESPLPKTPTFPPIFS